MQLETPRNIHTTTTEWSIYKDGGTCSYKGDKSSSYKVELPTIDEDEIETIIIERYSNTVRQVEMTHYFDNEKLHFIVYDNRDNEKNKFQTTWSIQMQQYR